MTRSRHNTTGTLGQFPPVPAGMAEDQARIWTATVRSFPTDWFKGSDLPLLVELCRAYATADSLAERIASTTDLDELKKLLSMRDTEARRAASLATKLRLPPQSRSDRHLAGAAARHLKGTARPWEFGDGTTNRFSHNGVREQ